MTERPIIFSAESVRGVLLGSKTQTRRVIGRSNSLVDGYPCNAAHWAEIHFEDAFVDPGPSPAGNQGPYLHADCHGPIYGHDGARHRIYPRFWAGDRLWVKETWFHDGSANQDPRACWFKADRCERDAPGVRCEHGPPKWSSSMFMPRWASRITLEITGVRTERVQLISSEDAAAEGMGEDNPDYARAEHFAAGGSLVEGGSPERFAFLSAWERINGKKFPWSSNPWVWIYEFKRIKS